MNSGHATTGAATPEGSGATNRIILLATASPLDQQLGQRLFARHGNQVRVVDTGEKALIESSRSDLDVVILDWWLPDADGIEVAQTIRERERAGDIRRPIFMIVDDDEEARRRCREVGMDGILDRPLCYEQFSECLARLQRSSGRIASDGIGETEEIARIRWEEALELVGGRRDLLVELVDIFMVEYPPTLTAIQRAIDQHDAKGLQLSAHKLKGCLRYFGETSAAARAKRLEQLGRDGNLDNCLPEFELLAADIARMVPSLRAGPGSSA